VLELAPKLPIELPALADAVESELAVSAASAPRVLSERVLAEEPGMSDTELGVVGDESAMPSDEPGAVDKEPEVLVAGPD
jgi:hypothetical protein